MLKPTFVLLILFTSSIIYSQTSVGIETVTVSGEKVINDLLIEEKASQLLTKISDSKKLEINLELKEILKNELTKGTAFRFPFKKVKSISILTPEDSVFRLFSWNLSYADGTHSYECGLLKRNSDNSTSFYFLNALQNDSSDLEQFVGDKDNWPGGLYYKVIERKNKFQTYYTLLAWEGSDLLLNKKFIDVLWFDRKGNAKFGAPIFKSNSGTKSRVVFKFGGQNVMKLNYVTELNRILFDHLSAPPSDEISTTNLEGIYEYYGPDLSFDSYDWVKGRWVFMADVDADESLSKKKKHFPTFNKENIQEQNPIYSPK